MPPLPRILKKVEASRTPAIGKMMLEKYGTCFWEVKMRGRKVLPHQRSNLEKCASDEGFYFKIPDTGRLQPFDGFCAKNAPSFIVWIERDRSVTIEKVPPLT